MLLRGYWAGPGPGWGWAGPGAYEVEGPGGEEHGVGHAPRAEHPLREGHVALGRLVPHPVHVPPARRAAPQQRKRVAVVRPRVLQVAGPVRAAPRRRVAPPPRPAALPLLPVPPPVRHVPLPPLLQVAVVVHVEGPPVSRVAVVAPPPPAAPRRGWAGVAGVAGGARQEDGGVGADQGVAQALVALRQHVPAAAITARLGRESRRDSDVSHGATRT
jgi:hypothetical protein